MRTVLILCQFSFAQLLAAPPAGSWKLTLPTQSPITLLLAFSESEGKWVADVIDTSAKLRAEPKVTDLKVTGDAVSFSLKLTAETTLTFDGVVSKDGKLKGSLDFGGGALRTIELFPSKLKSLQDSFAMAKEGLEQTEDPDAVFENARDVLKQAAAKKMSPEDARAVLDRAGKVATGSGRRWERFVTLKLAETLASQDGYADVALAQARKAERMLADDDDVSVRMQTLEALIRTLLAAKKPEDAKPYQTQLVRLEAKEWADYAKANPSFKIDEFKGRKGKSDRVVLVECISGTEFEPSAAIDLARDAVIRAYKPSDVVVLTYHLPLNEGGDPLTAPDALERVANYAKEIRGGQHALVAGKKSIGLSPNTRAKDAEAMFTALCERINAELEEPARVKLSLTVAADKDGFSAKANVTELEKPSDTMTLRFVLAEERIRWPAVNGTKYHQMVVRGFPGGAKGFPLKTATLEQTASIKPDELKVAIGKVLTEMGTEGVPLEKIAAFRSLKVVAFVQDDKTGDVLTAAIADVK